LYSECHAQKVIASFEEEVDFKNVIVTPGAEVSRSTDFPALKTHSCKAVFPEKGGEVSLINLSNTNWSREEALLLFIWTHEVGKISLIIKDSLNNYYNRQYAMKQGANHVQLSLSDLGKIDKTHVTSIGIHTENKAVLYLDYVSLDQYQPVLDKRGRWDVGYSTEIKTPHFSWGKGFVNGPIKSYSISPVFDGRGIVELAERLNLDFKVTTQGRTIGEEKWGFGDFYGRRDLSQKTEECPYSLTHNYIADDLMFSPEYDVIIWPGLHPWESYPEQVRNSILERVKNGTGLVLLYPISDKEGEGADLWKISPLKSLIASKVQKPVADSERWTIPPLDSSSWSPAKPHYITRGVCFEAFPYSSMGVIPYRNNQGEVLIKSAKGNPVMAINTYGKGRIVAFSYPERGFLPRIDNPWGTGLQYPYWEYLWSMLARSVVWAANKEPEAFIEQVTRTSEGIGIVLQNKLDHASLLIQVTDDFGAIEQETALTLAPKQNHAAIPLKNTLNGGGHIVNVIMKGKRGVYDWFSLMFHKGKIGEIISVTSEKPEIPIGEKVHTLVKLKTGKFIKGRLTSRLYDNYERLVDEQKMDVTFTGEKEYAIILNPKNILTNLAKSEYIFEVNGHQADHQVAEHFILQPRVWNDYDITMYHFGPNPVPGVWPAVDQQLQNLNVTTLAAYTLENSKHANYKVQAQTRITGVESPDEGPNLDYYTEMKKKYLGTNDKHLLIRKYGLKDSVYLNTVREELKTMISKWKKFSPSAYYIFEEPSVTSYDDPLDLCFRETTMRSMRDWLKNQYETLEALNKQWGTSYKQWEEVIPDDSREARKRGNYSSWADHRSFMEICWSDLFKFVQKSVNEIDPGGLVQLSGTQAASSHNGYDYSLLDQYVGQMNPYDIGNQLEYHHTFNPDLKISGQAGYGALGKGVLYDYYNHLFLKETGGSYIFWQVSSLNPDLRICEAGKIMKEGFDEMLKRGIGRLIGSYEPENELKIAIHYSYPSIHAAWIADGKIGPDTEDNGSKTLAQFDRNRDGWVKILHDMGVGFNFISYSAIEKGGLLSNGYKILILPMSMALSDQEVKNIEAFVKQGGILIADALPGVMDNHTKFRKERALADIFGISARSFTPAELITPDHESDLKITTAKVILNGSESKVQLLQNNFAGGKAYLLNYFMDKYPEEKLSHTNEPSLAKLKKLFDSVGLNSGIVITSPTTGETENGIEKYVLSDAGGSTRLLGLLPGKVGKDRAVLLHLKEPVYLYDIRNRVYFGKGNEFEIKIKNSVPELFALLQGSIQGFKINAASQTKLGETIALDFNMTGEKTSNLNSVATVEVLDPTGKKVNHYSKNCDIKSGAGHYSFNIAMNDPKGTWKIRVTEVISNIPKEISVIIN
jgi:hypothetical protein